MGVQGQFGRSYGVWNRQILIGWHPGCGQFQKTFASGTVLMGDSGRMATRNEDRNRQAGNGWQGISGQFRIDASEMLPFHSRTPASPCGADRWAPFAARQVLMIGAAGMGVVGDKERLASGMGVGSAQRAWVTIEDWPIPTADILLLSETSGMVSSN